MRNRAELVTALRSPQDPKLAIQLFRTDRPENLDRFLDLVTQLLHNYVAGSMTLVDQTWRLLNRYKGTPFFIEFGLEWTI